MTIQNPVEWTFEQFRLGLRAAGEAGRNFARPQEAFDTARPMVRQIDVRDLMDALVRGFDDFRSARTDVIFICLIYPLAGLVLGRLTLGYEMLPLLFPLASGFALLGPLAATGLYEMSRRRERGETVSWTDAFRAFKSPAIGEIVKFGLVLACIYVLWMLTAALIYGATMGWHVPDSLSSFTRAVLTTPSGWTLMVVGVGAGFCFALLVLAIGTVSVPLMLDRNVDVWTAIGTSVEVIVVNPVPILAWGMIVAAALVAGAVPVLLGLIVVLPVLGHATWHLYRRAVL